jgi:hypothetical protein
MTFYLTVLSSLPLPGVVRHAGFIGLALAFVA